VDDSATLVIPTTLAQRGIGRAAGLELAFQDWAFRAWTFVQVLVRGQGREAEAFVRDAATLACTDTLPITVIDWERKGVIGDPTLLVLAAMSCLHDRAGAPPCTASTVAEVVSAASLTELDCWGTGFAARVRNEVCATMQRLTETE